MNLSDREKLCLQKALEFRKEAAAQIGFSPHGIYADSVLITTSTMLGNLAADKYRACIADQPAPQPTRKATHR